MTTTETPQFCSECGHSTWPDDTYCTTCGHPIDETGNAREFWVALVKTAPCWRAAPSPWLVFALMMTTFGFYEFYWLFSTWRQFKAEEGDTTKSPVWHAFSVLVPIYGLFRLHAHMRAIRDVAIQADVRVRWSPALLVAGWLAINIAERVPNPKWVTAGLLVLEAALFALPQAALTNAWRKLPGGAPRRPVHPVEWMIILVGGLVTVAALHA